MIMLKINDLGFQRLGALKKLSNQDDHFKLRWKYITFWFCEKGAWWGLTWTGPCADLLRFVCQFRPNLRNGNAKSLPYNEAIVFCFHRRAVHSPWSVRLWKEEAECKINMMDRLHGKEKPRMERSLNPLTLWGQLGCLILCGAQDLTQTRPAAPSGPSNEWFQLLRNLEMSAWLTFGHCIFTSMQ